jgi:opacity protein-like surface antigen
MKKILLAAALAAIIPTGAYAQSADETSEPTAPDGTKAFGIEPYFGVLGGYHDFDRRSEFGSPRGGKMNGALISGVAGVNIPLGPVFIGAEGNATKGFGDIDWEYGVKGRIGGRAGESGLIYASAGYQWVNGKRAYSDQKDWIYGVGVEVGPKDIGLGGITGNSGIRLRLSAETYDFDSIRPMAGVIAHF